MRNKISKENQHLSLKQVPQMPCNRTGCHCQWSLDWLALWKAIVEQTSPKFHTKERSTQQLHPTSLVVVNRLPNMGPSPQGKQAESTWPWSSWWSGMVPALQTMRGILLYNTAGPFWPRWVRNFSGWFHLNKAHSPTWVGLSCILHLSSTKHCLG